MLKKEVAIVILEKAEESLKYHASQYDLHIFNSYNEFREYAAVSIIDIDKLIISTNELKFESHAVIQFLQAVNNTFVTLRGELIYIIEDGTDKDEVLKLQSKLESGVRLSVVEDDLSSTNNTVRGILEGIEGNKTNKIKYTKVVRKTNEEFARSIKDREYTDNSDKLMTDDDLLEAIHSMGNVSALSKVRTKYILVAGEDSLEKYVYICMMSKFISSEGKVLMVESDISENKMLTDMVYKTNPHVNFHYLNKIYGRVADFLEEIKNSDDKIHMVTSKYNNKINYHEFMNVMYNNIQGSFSYIIEEVPIEDMGMTYVVNMVFANNIPSIVKMVSKLGRFNPSNVNFIAVDVTRTRPFSLPEPDVRKTLEVLTGRRIPNLHVMTVSNLGMEGEVNYDLQSLCRSNDRR